MPRFLRAKIYLSELFRQTFFAIYRRNARDFVTAARLPIFEFGFDHRHWEKSAWLRHHDKYDHATSSAHALQLMQLKSEHRVRLFRLRRYLSGYSADDPLSPAEKPVASPIFLL